MNKMHLITAFYAVTSNGHTIKEGAAVFTVSTKDVKFERAETVEEELKAMVAPYCVQQLRYNRTDLDTNFADKLMSGEYKFVITKFQHQQIRSFDPLVPLNDLTKGERTRIMDTESEIVYENKVANIARMFEDSQRQYGGAIDTLISLVENGPLFDGDVPSKRGRNELIELGLSTRIVVKGEDGQNAATHLGYAVYKRYFGKSSSFLEAKAFRIARREIRSASSVSK